MANRFVFLLLLAIFVRTVNATSGVADMVRTLGRGSSEIEDIHTLAKKPDMSVPLLIDELHVISDQRLLNGQNPFTVEHVLWSIIALRFITNGKDFCAPTSHVFGKSEVEQNRKYWLEFKHGSPCLTFFAIWPSRMSTYIAPSDAQRSIIQQWRTWFREEGKKGSFTPLKDPTPDQWLW